MAMECTSWIDCDRLVVIWHGHDGLGGRGMCGHWPLFGRFEAVRSMGEPSLTAMAVRIGASRVIRGARRARSMGAMARRWFARVIGARSRSSALVIRNVDATDHCSECFFAQPPPASWPSCSGVSLHVAPKKFEKKFFGHQGRLRREAPLGSRWLLAERLVLTFYVELDDKPDMTGFHRWLGCRNGPMALLCQEN